MTGSDLAVAPIDRSLHRARARAALGELADGLLVTNRSNIRWLTGFTGSAGVAVLTTADLVLITDGRYGDRAQAEVETGAVRVVVAREQRDAIVDVLGGGGRVALEADDISWGLQRTVASEWLAESEIVASDGMLRDLRSTKQPAEIERIERAAAITDAALASVLADGLLGRSEASIAWEIEGRMRSAGADRAGYDPIVASGPNAARPHHDSAARSLARGDLVIVDVGAEVDGYRSDMTRTFVLGSPSPRQRALLDAVTAAQAAGVDAARAGVIGADVDAACRSVLEAAGLVEAFLHGTGHGVGLEIHEPPLLGRRCTAELAADQVVTVEPGVYFEGEGGVRIEDTVHVTGDGAIALTRAPKDPILD